MGWVWSCGPQIRFRYQGSNAVCFLFLEGMQGIQQKEADVSPSTRYVAYLEKKHSDTEALMSTRMSERYML